MRSSNNLYDVDCFTGTYYLGTWALNKAPNGLLFGYLERQGMDLAQSGPATPNRPFFESSAPGNKGKTQDVLNVKSIESWGVQEFGTDKWVTDCEEPLASMSCSVFFRTCEDFTLTKCGKLFLRLSFEA